MKRRLATVALFSFVLCSGFICKDPYGASAKAGDDIAGGIAQGFSTVTQLQQQGSITSGEALDAAGYLKFANDGNKAFLSCVKTAHAGGSKAGTFTACAKAFDAALNTPEETKLIHASNPSAQATIRNVVNGITAGVQAVITGLGGA